MLENIIKDAKNLGRKFLIGSALIGSLYIGGCAITTPSRITEGEGMTLVGAMMEDSNDPLATKLAPYVSLLGQMRYQKEVVREGRTQININQQQPQTQPQTITGIVYAEGKYRPSEDYVWVNPEDRNDLSIKKFLGSGFSIRWVDYDGDGKLNPSGEDLVEVKKRFQKDEGIALLLMDTTENPSRNLTLYSPKGEKIYTWEGMSGAGLTSTVNNALLQKYGEGEYSAVWRIDGKIMDSITFDLIY